MPLCSHCTELATKKKKNHQRSLADAKKVCYKSNDQRAGNPTSPGFSKDRSSNQHWDIRNKQHGNPIQAPLNARCCLAGVNGCLIRALFESFGFHQPMGATLVARVALAPLSAPINGEQRVVPPHTALTANANGGCLDQRRVCLSFASRETLPGGKPMLSTTDSTSRFYFQPIARWLRARDRSFASSRPCFGQLARTQNNL